MPTKEGLRDGLLDFDVSEIPSLVLDLRAESFSNPYQNQGGLEGAWLDSSGKNNHLEGIHGPGPFRVENGINGYPVVRFGGDSILSMANNLMGHDESYTVFTIARYCGENRGRVISSKNNNWLFGFNNGSIEAFYAGTWLSMGRESTEEDWQLQSAVVDLDSDTFDTWNNGNVVSEGKISDEMKLTVIGKLSVGGWRKSGEHVHVSSGSDCEIARVLVYNDALGDHLRRHVEMRLGMMYSISGIAVSQYIDWSKSLGESIRNHPNIARTSAELAYYVQEDVELALHFLDYCEHADKDVHHLAASIYESAGKSLESGKFRYTSFFLAPNDIGAIKALLENTNESGKKGDLLGQFQLVHASSILGAGAEDALESLKKHLEDSGGGLGDPLLEPFKKYENLLESGKISEFLSGMDSFLLEDENECSNVIVERLNKLTVDSEIRSLILERLNKNSENDAVIRYSSEYFKFNKRRFVGGFADRVKGVATAMLLSISTGRRFEIDWKHPFELSEVFRPRGYDWRVRDNEIEMEQVILVDKKFTETHREIIRNGEIEEIFGGAEKSTEVCCNIFFPNSIENPSLDGQFEEFSEIFNQPNIIGTVLSMFEYRPNVNESVIIRRFIRYLEMFDDSIAVHFRTGGDGGWEDPVVDSEENVIKLLEEARSVITKSGKSTCVFFATDSYLLKERIQNRYGRELNLFSINIPLAHIDRPSGNQQIQGSRYAIMENYMISLCNHILAGRGAYSVIAANRRFKWPWRYFKTH